MPCTFPYSQFCDSKCSQRQCGSIIRYSYPPILHSRLFLSFTKSGEKYIREKKCIISFSICFFVWDTLSHMWGLQRQRITEHFPTSFIYFSNQSKPMKILLPLNLGKKPTRLLSFFTHNNFLQKILLITLPLNHQMRASDLFDGQKQYGKKSIVFSIKCDL